MSPLRACDYCGAPGCTKAHGRKPAARRTYSDTAEYRAVRDEVLEQHGPTCVLYCNGAIDVDRPKSDPHSLALAHVVSHADGGTFEASNLRPAHRICNQRAGR